MAPFRGLPHTTSFTGGTDLFFIHDESCIVEAEGCVLNAGSKVKLTT